jgi:hypothetical protein
MSKLMVYTQVFENYAWGEDGTLGTGVNAYWKPKGGSDYVLKNFTDYNAAAQVVETIRSRIECDNDAFREYIVDWEVVPDDHMTWFEKSQLEYEGKITHGPHEIVL